MRTQVANEHDQVEQGGNSVTVDSLGGIHSDLDDDSAVGPEVSSADMFRTDRVFPIQTRRRVGNHLKLNLDSRHENARTKMRKESSRVTEFLSDRIKPIGQGQAFGYAASCS